MGDNARLRNNSTFITHGNGKIIFGNRAGASWGCTLEASELIRIGDYTAIAEYSYVTDTVHELIGNDTPWRDAPRRPMPVIIGEACFIGSGCYIGPGVHIDDGAVIAHHSVVTRNVGAFEIWAGAPARCIAHRVKGVSQAKLEEFHALVAEQGMQRDRYKQP